MEIVRPLPRPRIRGLISLAMFAAVAGAWWLALRPAVLGGPMGTVVIRGSSMLPGYRTGDLVLTRRERAYRRGQIVAYRVPGGQFGAGTVVIHRITGGSGENGFVLRGDNNTFDDDWHPKTADVVGRAWVHVPKAGAMLAPLRAPVPLAAATAAFTIVFMLIGATGSKRKTKTALTPGQVAALGLAIVHGGAHGTRAVSDVLRLTGILAEPPPDALRESA